MALKSTTQEPNKIIPKTAQLPKIQQAPVNTLQGPRSYVSRVVSMLLPELNSSQSFTLPTQESLGLERVNSKLFYQISSCDLPSFGPRQDSFFQYINDNVVKSTESTKCDINSTQNHKRQKCGTQQTAYVNGRGFNRWTELEEIFLSGIVMDMYYRRHSLKPTNQEKENAKAKGASCDMLVWQEIWNRYNLARKRFEILTGRITAERSVKSLQRHWKETGLKTTNSAEESKTLPPTKLREKFWDEKYNICSILNCTEDSYCNLLRDVKMIMEYKRIHCEYV